MRRIVLFVFWPQAVWRDLSAHPVAPRRLVFGMLLPLAIGTTLAHQAGWSWFNSDWSATYGWSAQPLFGTETWALIFALALGGPLLLAAAFVWLAPWCGGRRDARASLTVAVWGTLPLLVTACSVFFMPMILACLLAGAWCLRLYAQGVCVLLDVPREDGPDLVAGAMFTMAAATSIAGLGLELL